MHHSYPCIFPFVLSVVVGCRASVRAARAFHLMTVACKMTNCYAFLAHKVFPFRSRSNTQQNFSIHFLFFSCRSAGTSSRTCYSFKSIARCAPRPASTTHGIPTNRCISAISTGNRRPATFSSEYPDSPLMQDNNRADRAVCKTSPPGQNGGHPEEW